ncbi:MAG: Maf-like protein [Gammaproteobacteria bacterium]|nr:Maf-like protein [Gammaproteobacteria bacterium]
MHTLVLASTSPFRRQILSKLHLDFIVDASEVEERILENETPAEAVKRLSKAKAMTVAPRHPDALIIGSDQVAVFNNQILGKPHTHENAVQQLKAASGHRVDFFTGLCLYNSATQHAQVSCVPFAVYFRHLSDEQIDRYLWKEQPYNCAGSFKSEGLGITLFEKLQGDDPNTLIGLPLIELVRMLHNEGIELP